MATNQGEKLLCRALTRANVAREPVGRFATRVRAVEVSEVALEAKDRVQVREFRVACKLTP